MMNITKETIKLWKGEGANVNLYTHGGVFHADDVLSTALLSLLFGDNVTVNRVFKVPEELPEHSIIFDIGGGQFDHHQEDNECRENGIPYASLGKLWREFSPLFCTEEEAEYIENKYIQWLDAADNGVDTGQPNMLSCIISSMNPAWDSDETPDEAFAKATALAKNILKREYDNMLSRRRAVSIVSEALEASDGNIVIMEQFAPWQNILVPSGAKYVVYPSIRGGWNAQCVPTDVGGFTNKKSFPAEWGGKREELAEILPGLTFCHAGLFLCAADTKETAIEACKIALAR